MKKKIKIKNIIIILLLLLGSTLITTGLLWIHYTGKVSNNKSLKTIVIEPGTNSSKIGNILEENGLIKSTNFFKIYLKINKIYNLKAGTYELSCNMTLKQITDILQKGNNYNANEITITFKEGLNIREIANVIEENTNNTYDDVLDLVKDKTYLKELIDEYWFINEDILNNKLYYSLEGYLFPETYRFSSKDVSVKEIFDKLIKQMGIVLEEYKDEIENSKYSVHELLTLASVVEKEGKKDDFINIATVFHNRLNKKMKLESCATTYYGMKLEFNETGIANSEMIANKNSYNTYQVSKLPIGPISTISKAAIEATIKPKKDKKYLYFLSDNEGKTYFFNTYQEHQNKQQQLINAGKWYR